MKGTMNERLQNVNLSIYHIVCLELNSFILVKKTWVYLFLVYSQTANLYNATLQPAVCTLSLRIHWNEISKTICNQLLEIASVSFDSGWVLKTLTKAEKSIDQAINFKMWKDWQVCQTD